MTDYSWLKVGAKVRIKTDKELKEIYPIHMPYGLVESMLPYLGTTQIVTSCQPCTYYGCAFRVGVCGFAWPEGAFLPPTTPKGNSL
jgi:hypothetical protein